MQSENSVII